MYAFNGKTAVVTGGGSGIGRAIAQRLAKEGAKVLVIARNQESLKETADPYPQNISWLSADLTDDSSAELIARKIESDFSSRLDILVNNAGWCPVQPVTQLTVEDYDKAFSIDARAVMNLTVHLLKYIVKARGNIINMSSVGASHPAANLSMYTAAKAAVENFTKVWTLDLAGTGVRVNAIAPGAVRTNIWNVTNLPKEAERAHEEHIASTIPVKRFARPEEIAAVAAFLCSKEASYITGAVIPVDGGQSAV